MRNWPRDRLRRSHNYWLATTPRRTRRASPPPRTDLGHLVGRPLLVQASYAGQKVDNIAARSSVVVTTETPREVVILEGTAAQVGEDALADTYAETFDSKYGDGWRGVDKPAFLHFCVVPATVRA